MKKGILFRVWIRLICFFFRRDVFIRVILDEDLKAHTEFVSNEIRNSIKKVSDNFFRSTGITFTISEFSFLNFGDFIGRRGANAGRIIEHLERKTFRVRSAIVIAFTERPLVFDKSLTMSFHSNTGRHVNSIEKVSSGIVVISKLKNLDRRLAEEIALLFGANVFALSSRKDFFRNMAMAVFQHRLRTFR